MKNTLFILLLLFCSGRCWAQGDTVRVRDRLTDSVIERYYVQKANRDIKQGPYKAFYRRHTLIASGNFDKNVKTGTWEFFDAGGKLVEKYDYTNQEFTYEAPTYASDNLSYLFDDTIKAGDKATRPIKIGGFYYGFIPYVTFFKLPFSMFDIDTYDFVAYVELLVSPLGRLADYNVRVVSDYYQYDQTFRMDIGLLKDEDRVFIPATLNGKPVMSRILIQCFVTADGGLNF